MTISIPPDLREMIEEKVREGVYSSPEEVVRAALDHFLGQDDDFAPGELYALLAAGTADIEAGRVHAGAEVCQEIRRASAERREARST
ncbi:MAG TPA: ribbon-helix-helix domain-containing protein [Gemmataceae bacterium]|nr:ribbon-helix-helix domain-containing protein [Gemmataceae bacterium]